MATKIFVGNYKGGVGKTTSVFHISNYITKLQDGKNVLMIDLDPQCSLSEICMTKHKKNLEDLEDEECLNYILDIYNKKFRKYNNIDIKLDVKNFIKRQSEGVDFIPSSLYYKENKRGLDIIVGDFQKYEDSIFILSQFILDTKLDEIYDYIIFDCPPSNNIITQSAFLISDYYLIPTIMDNISAKGVRHYVNSVDNIYNNFCKNHEDAEVMKVVFKEKPHLLGIFETLYKYNVSNGETIESIKRELSENKVLEIEKILNEYDNIIFNTRISNYIDIARGTAVGEQNKKTEGYRELTEEILNRINKHGNK